MVRCLKLGTAVESIGDTISKDSNDNDGMNTRAMWNLPGHSRGNA